MDINRDNYEAFLLDWIEGRLSSEEIEQVHTFLSKNPDCAGGLEGTEPWTLNPEKVSFPGKEKLIKELPGQETGLARSGFDMFSIARLEGDLSPSQVEEHEKLISTDKEKKQEWRVWQQTRLPVETITYRRKGRLKKGRARYTRVLWMGVISAAATVALVITLLRTGTGVNEVIPEQEISSEPLIQELENVIEKTDKPLLADEPVTLSIRKHQVPPELTGKEQSPANDTEQLQETGNTPTDSTGQQIDEQKIQPAPLRLAMAERRTLPVPDYGYYDKVTPFEIPTYSESPGNRFMDYYAEMGLWQATRKYARNREITLLSVASAGISGINRITGSDLALDVTRDEAGNTSGFRFSSDWLTFAAPVGDQK